MNSEPREQTKLPWTPPRMANKKIVYAALIVVIVLLIATTAWYLVYRYRTVLVPSAADGSNVALSCSSGPIAVIAARYTAPAAARATDVSAALQAAFDSMAPPYVYTVNGTGLGQTPGGTLTFRYRCNAVAKSGFRPVPISTCGAPYDDHYAVDMSGRNAAGTVVWDPYSTQSRVSLERYAETPEIATTPDPVSGLGKTSTVRALGDRYRSDALARMSAYELQPGEPGYMEEVGDGMMSLLTQVARRSPAVSGGAPSCLLAGTDVDTDYLPDGFYGEAVLREALTSKRRAEPNTLTASKTGLGSIRLDPRFEPGPQSRVPDGDASWSHGGSAGGPTSGGFASSRFMPGNTYDWTYVFGFGDRHMVGREYPVEALNTERSDW